MMDEDKQAKISELKYEGLAALIQGNHEAVNRRLDDFRGYVSEEFTHLHEHNKKQNGSMVTAIKDIAKLKEDNLIHLANCPLAPRVRKLEDDNILSPRLRQLESESTTTKGIKKWLVGTIAVVGGVLTILWTTYKLFIEPLLETM